MDDRGGALAHVRTSAIREAGRGLASRPPISRETPCARAPPEYCSHACTFAWPTRCDTGRRVARGRGWSDGHRPVVATSPGLSTPSAPGSRRDDMRASGSLQRVVLPIPDAPPVGLTTYDAKDPDIAFPPIEPLRPPEGAPNVLIILLDDVGFGASSAFGGPMQHPDCGTAGGGRPASTPGSTPRRCARRRDRHSSPGGTTTRSGWATSPSWQAARQATRRSAPTPARRSRRR